MCIGRFVLTKFFNIKVYAAWASLEILAQVIQGFCSGMTAIISSDFSKLIMLKDISKTKRYVCLSTTIMVVFMFSLFSICYLKQVFLAEMLSNKKDIQKCI